MTGVPASTWEAIIARESNGQVNAANPSGASGLFQTMPGWGSTATVDDQIQAAYNAYSNQGTFSLGILKKRGNPLFILFLILTSAGKSCKEVR